MDTDLVARAQAGNLEAFDALVALHQQRVFALAYRLLGSAEDAADVQQETFVKAWRSIRKFRQEASVATWLHRITVNLCISRKRRKDWAGSTEFNEDIRTDPVEPDPTEGLQRAETAALVRRVLFGMPVHYRTLLVLREIEGRSFEEIAELVSCSVASARVRASKARQILKERLSPYLSEEEL